MTQTCKPLHLWLFHCFSQCLETQDYKRICAESSPGSPWWTTWLKDWRELPVSDGSACVESPGKCAACVSETTCSTYTGCSLVPQTRFSTLTLLTLRHCCASSQRVMKPIVASVPAVTVGQCNLSQDVMTQPHGIMQKTQWMSDDSERSIHTVSHCVTWQEHSFSLRRNIPHSDMTFLECHHTWQQETISLEDSVNDDNRSCDMKIHS